MKRFITLCLPLLLCIYSCAFAGSYGILTGRVCTTTGTPIIGASVRLAHTERGAYTKPDGKFTVIKILPGEYIVRVSSIAFKDYTTNVVITADKTTDISITMVGDAKLTDTVIVTAYSDVVQNDFVSRQAGVQPAQNGFVIRNGRTAETQYRIDGLDINDQFSGGMGGLPTTYFPTTTKQEGEAVQILSGGYTVEYGNALSSTVNPIIPHTIVPQPSLRQFVTTEQDNLSTFGMDVDNASYTLCRNSVSKSVLPSPTAVRTEEFLNYFNYGYAPPCEDEFAVYMECAPAPFGAGKTHLLKIGIKARELYNDERRDAALTFVIDVSGSMSDDIETVKRSMAELVRTLRPADVVSIVTFGSTAEVHLKPTSVSQREDILKSIAGIQITGSTNVGAGMKLGYTSAEAMFDETRINRVILIGDGVANNGLTRSDAILETVAASAKKGIYLTVVGIGMGTYNDKLMEELANRGNGKYYYLDNEKEIQRLFVTSQTGILDDVAHDAKIQVEFDPLVVKSYRLLGYENRNIADSLFRNDSTDAGEVGPGHTVTALYELEFQPKAKGTVATANIRYFIGQTKTIREIRQSISSADVLYAYKATSFSFHLAAVAAQYAELLRGSTIPGESFATLLHRADEVATLSGGMPEVIELRDLIAKASTLVSQPLTNQR